MSKIKKLGIIIFIAAIVILGLNIKSNAYSVGQQVKINYNKYITDSNMYCMEHNQALFKTEKKYKIISNVKIEGNKSTDHKGKTIESWYNAKMAAILTGDNGTNKESGPVQNAIWNFGYTWMEKVGQYHSGLYLGFANTSAGTSSSLDTSTTAYANNTNLELKDNTNKEKIKVVSYEKNGEKYLRIGPFNWTFSGKLTEIKVYNQDEKTISGLLYSNYKGTTENWFGLEGIKSETDFYISIPANNGTTKITKIIAKVEKEVKSVNIWFLEAVETSYQNILIREPYKATEKLEETFDYNIELLGNLLIEKLDKDNKNVKLSDVSFIIKNERLNKYVNSNNGVITYVDKAQATEFTTDDNGKVTINNLLVGNYIIYETKNSNYGYESVSFENPREVAKATVQGSTTYQMRIYNEKETGNIKIFKKDLETGNALAGMTFVLKASNGKYLVAVDEAGNEVSQGTGKVYFTDTNYTDDINQATKFITDDNGIVTISNIVIDTYEIIEYSVGDNYYGYEVDSDYISWEVNGKDAGTGVGIQVVLTRQTSNDTTSDADVTDSNADLITVKNRRKYVKLSGYVWVDKIAEKNSVRNDLYKENDYEYDDILLDGITVRLKDRRTGETVKETVTSELGRYTDSRNNGHGEYLFEDILIEDLEYYYIEFEYDGLTYTNVVSHVDKDNGSKAVENEAERDNFNNKFSVVEGDTENTGFTRDENGNKVHNLSYNIDKTAHTATLIRNGQYLITANTDETTYYIADHYTSEEEIRYINLGLYEREQPDIAVIKDLENVRLTINGYEHTYLYAQRNVNAGEYESGFNVGVKFGNEYGKLQYSRAVYKADYEYINEANQDKELKVYVTYKIAIKNQSTNLRTIVNSIVDYYDINYSIVNAGTSLDEKGNTNGNISLGIIENYNNQYSKTVITTKTEIEAQGVQTIYVQFALNREAVHNILNDGENLDNVVEINSYSVIDNNGKAYAGIDTDSNPGNAIPGDTTTYEDDTDGAPGLKLEVAGSREMTGKVFLDSTSGELMTGQIRQGSGIYEDGEQGIKGVEVTLTENTGSGMVYTAITDENGDFYISGFIPGDYTLTYTWGDETYTVRNYKGTIYNEPERQQDSKWYKQVDPRYSDAIDDYQTRLEIDNDEQTTISKMESTTPTMGIGVEYETTYTSSTGDKYVYEIKNIDFGIVERARQDIELTKRVKTMKVTLANGQVITDISIDENGNVTGEKKYLTYMGPSENAIPKNGYIKLELDNELIQGATVEVTYGIQAKNISELDYLSENFYKYGIVEGEVVKLEIKGLVDYLDTKWAFDETSQTEWQVKTLDEIQDIVTEEVYNSEEIKNRIILYTESLQGQKLEPNQAVTVDLYATKVLSNNEEINLNNEAEIMEIGKDGGSEIIPTPGNYIPGTSETSTENDDDISEEIIITPNTGENLEFIAPIIIGIMVCAILGVGVVIIKKRVLNK